MNTSALLEQLEQALGQLEGADDLDKASFQYTVLDLAGRLFEVEGGVDRLFDLAPRLDNAGVFVGTDWDTPNVLIPGWVRTTLEQGERPTIIIEVLSELRLLAIVQGRHAHTAMSRELARHFLTQVMALNLNYLFGTLDEVSREVLGSLSTGVQRLFVLLLENIGFDDVLGTMIEEIWRILSQRPIQMNPIKSMITQIAISISQDAISLGENSRGADRLVSSLFGPTLGSTDDPGLPVYHDRLAAMDAAALQQEAYGFARGMKDVGLVSDYHAAFLRWLLQNNQSQLIPDALGLSTTGLDALRSYQELVHTLIEEAIFPQTAQAAYGLSMLLESGSLYSPPIAPGLWRQIGLQLTPEAQALLERSFGNELPARVYLLSGVISLLGQPLGIGQGNNPTCQSARAISMWAYNDPDYLLHLIAQAAQFNGIMTHFEGQPLASAELAAGLMDGVPLDTDPVSVILVPHLDRIYLEMGRQCQSRGGDPHRWVNPEFHGWWVGREFNLAVDVATGQLTEFEAFVRHFYATYHPHYNGNQPVIHPQPAGLAVTDSSANFVGWHAITLLRVSIDQNSDMRIYFYNPNNDSGQDWGNGVVVSTQGHGERFGEASLPFAELASRLYIYHSEPLAPVQVGVDIPLDDIRQVQALAEGSWAKLRVASGEHA